VRFEGDIRAPHLGEVPLRLTSIFKKSYSSFSGMFIIAYHVGLLIGLPLYFAHHTPSGALVAASAVLLFLTQMGITAAYHRLYAHRAYQLSPLVEVPLLWLGTLAVQGSALRWSFEHRLHHSYVDTDRDPYSIKKGFWYAHVLWLFDPQQPIDEKRVKDLAKNRLVMLQHNWYGTLCLASNLLVIGLIGWAVGDLLGAFVLAGWTRLALSHHLTWFINSLAHTWGERTYSKEHSAVDNHIVALLTVGEGYHNYHHTFPSDYRNGVRWYHFDPSKWLIWGLSKVGLATKLRRFGPEVIRKRLLSEDRRLLLQTLAEQARAGKEELERRIELLAEAIHAKLARVGALVDEVRRLRRERAERAVRRERRRELRVLAQSLRRDWRSWFELCASVLRGSPTVGQAA
jgi:stearoyl-CoA desaturase (delta-9 desaturase)